MPATLRYQQLLKECFNLQETWKKYQKHATDGCKMKDIKIECRVSESVLEVKGEVQL